MWPNPTSKTCIDCQAAAPTTACDCPDFKAFGGLCNDQNIARRNEPTCTDAIANCAQACAKDCPCVDACYATAPNCKTVQAAEDGCLADVCTQYCQ
jgi:hypothetical protein